MVRHPDPRVVGELFERVVKAAQGAALGTENTTRSLDDLRPFINVTDEDWPFLLAWMLACLRPEGP